VKFWILPMIGAIAGGAYKAMAVGNAWYLTSDYVSRAVGSVITYALLGAGVGFLVAMMTQAKGPHEGQ